MQKWSTAWSRNCKGIRHWPYAEAVFQMALESGDDSAGDQLKTWSEQLLLLAGFGANQDVISLSGNPEVDRDDIAELVIESAGKNLNKDGANLIHLLLENGRLTLLPEISELFEIYKAEHEGSIEAEVISAYELANDQIKNISDALKKKLGREIKIVSRIDKSLVGGVVIRAGDLVIDGSVTGYLQEPVICKNSLLKLIVKE